MDTNDELYMLWTDTAPIEESAKKAIAHYRERYGKAPTIIERPVGTTLVGFMSTVTDIPAGHLILGSLTTEEARAAREEKDDEE